MDTLTFVAEIAKALAWPIAVLVLVLLARKPAVELLSYLRRIKYQDLELEFDKQIQDLKAKTAPLPKAVGAGDNTGHRDRLLKIAASSPEAAVMEAWRILENHLVEYAHRQSLQPAPAVWAMPLVLGGMLLSANKLSDSQFATLQTLKHLRDQITHTKGVTIPLGKALEYVDLTLSLQDTLNG
jgi:hypothetical protein